MLSDADILLLARFDLRRHKTDLVDAGALGDVDRVGNGGEIEIRITFHENDALGTGLEDFFKAWA